MVSTTLRLPPQLLPTHFLQLLAQTVLSPRIMKWQEVWVLIGLKKGPPCPPNISLHRPLLLVPALLRSAHMGVGFLLPYGLSRIYYIRRSGPSQVTLYLRPPNIRPGLTSWSAPEPAFYWTLTSFCFSWQCWGPLDKEG